MIDSRPVSGVGTASLEGLNRPSVGGDIGVMRNTALLVLALMVAGCGSITSDTRDLSESFPDPTSSSGASVATSPSTTAATSSSASTSAPSTTLTVEENLVVFIATLEELLVGTSYEGEALNEPDVFVATGRLFCERLDSGDSADDLLTTYLEQLAGGVDIATDDELVLAGALLGAAVGALCPEHASVVG
ncbi:MAG: DUF732 domain-containing protein [Acidobacteria bacterium]|nr:DUF732 domain-containing protein [Acidobacteriota bacterium]